MNTVHAFCTEEMPALLGCFMFHYQVGSYRRRMRSESSSSVEVYIRCGDIYGMGLADYPAFLFLSVWLDFRSSDPPCLWLLLQKKLIEIWSDYLSPNAGEKSIQPLLKNADKVGVVV